MKQNQTRYLTAAISALFALLLGNLPAAAAEKTLAFDDPAAQEGKQPLDPQSVVFGTTMRNCLKQPEAQAAFKKAGVEIMVAREPNERGLIATPWFGTAKAKQSVKPIADACRDKALEASAGM